VAGEEGTVTIRRGSGGEKERKTWIKVTREEKGWKGGRRGSWREGFLTQRTQRRGKDAEEGLRRGQQRRGRLQKAGATKNEIR
jgi:hypothetical protein